MLMIHIPTEIKYRQLHTKVQSAMICEFKMGTEYLRSPEIGVTSIWIKSDTLVEFEPIEGICSIHNSTGECQNATTSNMRCIWCERANMCINSNDKDTHELKVDDCLIKNTSVNTHVRFTFKRHSLPPYYSRSHSILNEEISRYVT
ncbi:unnamed protein product [Schistosoma margrebowiei]|uniref:Egg protein CP391S-like protein n=1 Tax=Schistosoma margrebowiei TaxID=48269 RepID=A0AA85AAE3_9TREM|nr:unnamed protein product [Schistosoma margrebowiei]